jgi:hypothetical protein
VENTDVERLVKDLRRAVATIIFPYVLRLLKEVLSSFFLHSKLEFSNDIRCASPISKLSRPRYLFLDPAYSMYSLDGSTPKMCVCP